MDEDETPAPLPAYTEGRYRQFVADMAAAGLVPWDYHGRFYYHGPAVTVGDLQDALGATKVRCQWDSMGKSDFVVYPK